MKKVLLKISGMSCSACQNSLEKYLNKQDGVKASVNLVMANALIEYDDNLTISDLEQYIKEAGFESLGIDTGIEEKKDYSKLFLIIFSILIIILMIIHISSMFVKYNHVIHGLITLILAIPFLIYGKDIIITGIKRLKKKSPNMDSLVTIGVITSFIYSLINFILILFNHHDLVKYLYFESSSMIIYFVKLGRFIENINKEKTKIAIKELVQITPSKAILKKKNEYFDVTIDEVKKGDILIAKPGMKIAVDGVITKGNSHIDESFITGESIPLKKNIKDKVMAGSINIDGVLEYKALKIGSESLISEVVHLVQESINTKTSIQLLADKVSSYFVPTIIVIAILTFFINLVCGVTFNDSLIRMISVLVVACPCAMGLATPLAIITANGECAKNGVLVKSSEIFEKVPKVNTIVFDKTGTLTYGDIRISRLANYSNYANDKLLNIVASLEKNSTHPIANAFKEYNPKYEVTDFNNIDGMGISGIIGRKKFLVGNSKILESYGISNDYSDIETNFKNLGNSILYVVENNAIIGLIGVKDIVRKNMKKVINKLKDDKDVILLTGDNKETAKIVADSLNIENIQAGLLPKDKQIYLKELKEENKLVMMVGDGINDAPSLTEAFVGVSVSSGSDIANDSADIILLNDDLAKINYLFELSRKTIKIIKENLFWALFYNLIMVLIATGIFKKYNLTISPSIASIAMTISSLTVILNSLRLKKHKKK